MKTEYIKPIPKYILGEIRRVDQRSNTVGNGLRFYSYLTKCRKELVKITVAVRNDRKGNAYYKQVAVHGIHSEKCFVKDMEYQYFGFGYRVGWHAEGLHKQKSFYEDGNWYDAEIKYYNPYSITVNSNYLDKFPEYRYSAYSLYHGECILDYLRLYEKYPQLEYVLKLGLTSLSRSVMILKFIGKDKNFIKWLIRNKDIIESTYHDIAVIIKAYKMGLPIDNLQHNSNISKQIRADSGLKSIRTYFKGAEFNSFCDYINKQDITLHAYRDYLTACEYLELDMNENKNRYPHDFKYWHDMRIDEYNTAKNLVQAKQRAEMEAKF
ncbi:MAG: hypothetical protein EOM87_07905, partial [Clostridia bacterium]|nr:hypothetical protein [Clostridia bacterium]